MNFPDRYKAFKKDIRRFPRFESLVALWAYSLHVVNRSPLLSELAIGKPSDLPNLSEHVYPWDLEILVREFLLHTQPTGDLDLRRWNDLAYTLNSIRKLEDLAYTHRGSQVEIWLHLHRVFHRQLRWQNVNDFSAITRVLKIFGVDAINALVVNELGMSLKQMLLLGLAIGGNFISKAGINTSTNYSDLGISLEASTSFFERISIDIDDLRRQLVANQSLDSSWLYTWNPLEARPLIRFDRRTPAQAICPIPRYLLSRVSTGIFYDLVNSRGFDNPYGHSFEAYIGEVLSITCKSPRFNLLAEANYRQRKAKLKHGTDWVLSDETGHLFVECKTKRLSLGAKNLTDYESLDSDLIVMAEAITQVYKNLLDALAGRTQWIANGLPVYPVVITLEEWHLYNLRLNETLKNHVCCLLAENQVNESVLEKYPYTIVSTQDLELVAQIIGRLGIATIMAPKTDSENRSSSLLQFVLKNFHDECADVQRSLFRDDFISLLPEQMKHL